MIKAETTTKSVGELVQTALAGDLRVPAFQRPSAWKSKNVIDLLDSVWRGYPIGSLLLSKKQAPSAILHFGRRDVVAPERPAALWIVDGQQRIIALVATLEHPSEWPSSDIHAIWFDLVKQEFFRNASNGERLLTSVPVRTLGDGIRLRRWGHAWPLAAEREDLLDLAFSVSNKLINYKVSTYVAEEADDLELREIFRRSNTMGVAMKDQEVFAGLYKGTELSIKTLQDRLEDIGLGSAEIEDDRSDLKQAEAAEKLLVSCHRWTVGAETKAIVDVPAMTAASFAVTEQAARAAFELIVEAGIPNINFLPYKPIFPVLTAFFAKFPSPTPTARELLIRFIWRGAVSGLHGHIHKTDMARLRTTFRNNDEDTALELLKTIDVDLKISFEWPKQWHGRSATTKIAACILVATHQVVVEPQDDFRSVADTIPTSMKEASTPEGQTYLESRLKIDVRHRRSVARLQELMSKP